MFIISIESYLILILFLHSNVVTSYREIEAKELVYFR